MMLKSVGELFDEEPQQWGLRGDPYLWRDLRSNLLGVRLPSSEPELHRLLENAFYEATGGSLAFCKDFYVEKFASGGMSSGQICGEFWRERGFPLVCDRWREIQRRRGI